MEDKIKFIMYCKIDDFLVLHFSDKQIIWHTTKAFDLLKKSKKICLLCYISSNLFSSKNAGKSSIFLTFSISRIIFFFFLTSQSQNVIDLSWIPCLSFFWQANYLRCNGGVWFSYILINPTPATLQITYLPKNCRLGIHLFFNQFHFCCSYKKITLKSFLGRSAKYER